MLGAVKLSEKLAFVPSMHAARPAVQLEVVKHKLDNKLGGGGRPHSEQFHPAPSARNVIRFT